MQLVATKLVTPPGRPDLVPRANLRRLLDRALHQRLTLVTAPPGFGKTTLVSGWLRDLPVRSAWLMLDEDDDQPGRFLDYWLAAVAELGAGGSAGQLLMAGPQSVPAVVTSLVNDLAELPDDAVLVLDDFHLIAEPEILDAVSFLVEHCPPRLHLVLVSRHEPDLPLARWRGRGYVYDLGSVQLRFTADEAGLLLRTVAGHAVEEKTVAALNSRAEGWAAGLQMLGIGLRDGARPASSVSYRSGDRYVLDYLAEEVLRDQPADVRDFLLRTSILDQLSAKLCDAVTGRADSAAMLRRLERANLFLAPLDDRYEWYRYHGLFADYLRRELDPAEAVRCHHAAAEWFAVHDLPAATIKHAVAAGDHDLAIRIVRQVAEPQIRRGQLAPLLAWLNRLPDDVVRGQPDLAGYKGWLLYLAGRVEDAESYARIAEDGIPADAPAADRAMLATFQAYLALTRNEPAVAAELATSAVDALGDSTLFFKAAAMGALGQARRLLGDRRGAIEVLRAAVRLGERSGNALSALESTGYLAPLLYVQGRLREAVALCEDALSAHRDDAGQLLPIAGLAEAPLGTLLYELDDLPAAEKHLRDGIARCEQLGTTSYALLGLRTLARLHIVKGQTGEALRSLTAARRQAEAAEDSRRARLVIATIAELHLRNGNPAAAEQALAEIAGGQRSSSDYEDLTRARLFLAKGRPRDALDVLAPIEARATSQGRDGSLIAILVATALARRALGEPTRDLLTRAVELAAPDGYRRTFLDEGSALLPLLREIRGSAFADELVSRLGRTPRRARSAELLTVDGVGVVEPLTDTQRHILRLIATGMSNQQVADKLFITVGTTKWHLNQIFGRLQARNRTEAVARARELDLL